MQQNNRGNSEQNSVLSGRNKKRIKEDKCAAKHGRESSTKNTKQLIDNQQQRAEHQVGDRNAPWLLTTKGEYTGACGKPDWAIRLNYSSLKPTTHYENTAT